MLLRGARLTRSARHVFIAGRSVPEVVALPIGAARRLVCGTKIAGRRRDAARIVREISERLDFLVRSGWII